MHSASQKQGGQRAKMGVQRAEVRKSASEERGAKRAVREMRGRGHTGRPEEQSS